MKKLFIILAAVLLSTALWGCTKPDKPDNPSELPADVEADTPSAETNENSDDKAAEKDAFGFITLSKCERLIQEWGESLPKYEVKWQNLKLSEEDAKKYPLLSIQLDKMNSEDDNAAILAKEDFAQMFEENDGEELGWYFYQSTEYFLQRADDVIVSLLSNYEDYTGGVHGYYSTFGYNIDPKTGKDVAFSDIVTDRASFDKLIYDSLVENYPEEIYEDNRQQFYDDRREYGYNWSIDYNKLTVYFNPYEIASFAAGIIKVDVWFDEHPGLFNEKYTKAPSSYAVELPDFEPYTFDIDKNDGKRDTITVGSYEYSDYECGEISISINEGEYRDSGLYGFSLTPLLICVEGKYYVYAEVGQFDGGNVIHIYDINESTVKKVKVFENGFKKLWDYSGIDYGGYYREIVNNPESMNFERYFRLIDTRNTAYRNYSANPENGIPESEDKVYTVNEDNYKKLTIREVPVTITSTGKKETLPPDTTLTLKYTDCETYIDALLDDGRMCRITVETKNEGTFIDGVDTIQCFTDIYPDYGFEEEVTEPEYDFAASLDVPYVYYEEEYLTEDGNLSAPSKIELIQLVADENNEAANKINAEINELYQEYLYDYGYSDEVWCEFFAWPTVTDRYINAVITYVSYPTYGTYGSVVSWVYDKQTGKQYTLEEALSDAGMTKAGLLAEFNEAVYSSMGGKAVRIDSLAFRMLPDGKLQFLAGVELEYSSEADTWVNFMTWSEEGVANHGSVPFDPVDVTGNYSNELYCQTLVLKGQQEENFGPIKFEDASKILSEIYDVKTALESGMILIDAYDVEYIDNVPHTRIDLATDDGENTVREKFYAVAPGSVYQYISELNEWTAVGFG